MGFFPKRMRLYAPMAGTAVPLTQVPDPAFSGEMLGKGLAILPQEGKIYAPCDGAIDTIFPTGHGLTLVAPWGGEILIHVGLETVTLESGVFTPHVAAGQQVKRGQLLLKADLEAIRVAGRNPITPVVLCNWRNFSDFHILSPGEVTAETAVMELRV